MLKIQLALFGLVIGFICSVTFRYLGLNEFLNGWFSCIIFGFIYDDKLKIFTKQINKD